MATVLKFTLEKVTKNTIRYQEEPATGQPPIIGTLYVQKFWLGSPPPQSLEVKIEKTQVAPGAAATAQGK